MFVLLHETRKTGKHTLLNPTMWQMNEFIPLPDPITQIGIPPYPPELKTRDNIPSLFAVNDQKNPRFLHHHPRPPRSSPILQEMIII